MLKLYCNPATGVAPSTTCVSISVGRVLYFGRKDSNVLKGTGTENLSFDSLSSFSAPVVALQFSGCGQYLAASCEDKTLKVWSLSDLKEIAKCTLSKRATSLLFSPDCKYLLTGDKTGDIKRCTKYSINESMRQVESILLGHSSILLDTRFLRHITDDIFIATCDRDEKIRISHHPNSYNIHTYCLGHKDFVSRLCTCRAYPHLLISGSGDGTVRVWDWYKGMLLYTLTLGKPAQPHQDEPPTVTDICSSLGTPPILAVLTDSITGSKHCVTLARLGPKGELEVLGEVHLENALTCQFDEEGKLWIMSCEDGGRCEVQVYSISNEGKTETISSDLFIDHINQVLRSSEESVSSTLDWSSLRKHDYDNISAYYSKKDERIKSKKMKLDTGQND